MSDTIQILEDNLINKIAAGEVIENPASVVKELVENAIDAKSQNIVIEIKKAGLELIKVEDDGIGMSKVDALLCIKRHATSKIQTFDDLINAKTMGFRGEALASICSISKMEIKTSQNDIATHLKLNSSKLILEKQIARNQGTTIEVKSLFFNVPVRRKFQKSFASINSQIIKTIILLSLSQPLIGFTLILDDKVQFTTKNIKEDKKIAFKKRIKSLLADRFLDDAIDVDFKQNNIEIFGLISDPNLCRKTRSNQYLIINNRAVYSKVISTFVKEAYFTKISDTDFPVFALNINVPTSFIDVNVHPQKKEIRFREFIFIKEAVKKAINQAFENKFLKKEKPSFDQEIAFTKPEEQIDDFSFFKDIKKENIFEKFERDQIFENLYDFTNKAFDFFQLDNFLFIESQFFKNVIDIEDDEKVLMFNLSAIFSTYLFENIKDKKNVSKMITLLVPINIELNSIDIVFVEKNIEKFIPLGFDVRIISKNQICLDSIPDIVMQENIHDFFYLILEDLKNLNSTDKVTDIYEKKLAQKLSRFAKTKKYTKTESMNLLNLFIKCKNKLTDPVGCPIFSKLNKFKLEKIFQL
ncbi:MAG: DNA mismatch repair protein MutL [Candidatus Anoxychlamydiales bacterium]|nr:DNA mismatch repair protein MutL [Candidatus Anoxychlamydiales bacterium]